MFFDFSSAFITIQPTLLRDRLVHTGVDHHPSVWIMNNLNSPTTVQHVQRTDCEQHMFVCSHGVPKGAVLALSALDFNKSADCHLQRLYNRLPHRRWGGQGEQRTEERLLWTGASSTALRSMQRNQRASWLPQVQKLSCIYEQPGNGHGDGDGLLEVPSG